MNNSSLRGKIASAFKKGGVMMIFVRLFNKLRWSFNRPHYTQNLLHAYEKGLPKVEIIERHPSITTIGDVEIAERILRAYNLAVEDERKTFTGDLWDMAQNQRHEDFHKIKHDPAKVADYLNDMNRKGITWGISSSASEYDNMAKNAKLRQEWGAYIKDTILCLAEALGAIPYNYTADNIYLDTAEVVDKIEQEFGIPFIPSNIEGGGFFLKVDNKLFGHREAWSAYIAWRCNKLMGTSIRVGEIGGGLGKVAWYAKQMSIKHYALYDLPIICIVQAWFLIQSGLEVTLYGEEFKEGSIPVLPYWEFKKGTFDLVVNTDSFPEMHPTVLMDYLQTIKQMNATLLSINREDGKEFGTHTHHVVHNTIEKIGGFERVQRTPHWFSRNYVEEVYLPPITE